jgi:DNA polymerase-4
LLDGLQPAIAEVWEYCQRTGVRGRTITVKVKFADFQQITRSRSTVQPMPSQAALEQICRELVEGLLPLAKGVRLLGASLSNLNVGDQDAGTPGGRQLTLAF